ncbi:hypothetical protein ABPG75_013629 [Micractinium tetrahymenae]
MAAPLAALQAVEAGAAAPVAAEGAGAAAEGLTASVPHSKSLAHHLSSDEEKGVYAILMPPSFEAKEGKQLWPGVKLGKFLGAGAQAKVFRLAKDDGTPTGKVIKINHEDVASKLLNNNVVWVGMDREWEIGTQLRNALAEPGGNVPGFMLVADCLVRGGKDGGEGRFAGMIMGELHGWEVYKRMETPEFHNIHYVREMLFQVFSALDRAQRKLGFVHADLGMRNVMEHYPRLWEDMPQEEAEKMKEYLKSWGPGWASNLDGSRFPLGPEIEFKIIDFGISKFSPKVAAAAAGREAQEVVEELHNQSLKEQRVIFGSEDCPEELELSPGDPTSHSTAGWWKLCGFAKKAQFRIRRRREKVKAAAAAVASRVIGRTSSSQALATRLHTLHGDGYQEAVAAAAEASNTVEARRQKRRQKKSPIETMYRHWWHRKADVFHLLLTMALALDSRVWPEDDENEVLALMSLVHHITGIKMKAHFADPAEVEAARNEGSTPYGRKMANWRHWWRRWHIRFKAHVVPFNSGLLAREALSHPFFGAGEVQHASVPWKVGAGRWDREAGKLLQVVEGVEGPVTQAW